MGTQQTKEKKHPKQQTPTFLLELPLVVNQGQACRLRAHFEAARQLYNAILSEGNRRVRQMRSDAAWQAARAIPRTPKPGRGAGFSALRPPEGVSEGAPHEDGEGLRV